MADRAGGEGSAAWERSSAPSCPQPLSTGALSLAAATQGGI